MSSRPGLTLEDYVMWSHDIVVIDHCDANFSLAVAEALGNIKPRPRLTDEQFAGLIAIYEPYREEVENRLWEFDEDEHSWRSYASYAFDNLPDELFAQAHAHITRARR